MMHARYWSALAGRQCGNQPATFVSADDSDGGLSRPASMLLLPARESPAPGRWSPDKRSRPRTFCIRALRLSQWCNYALLASAYIDFLSSGLCMVPFITGHGESKITHHHLQVLSGFFLLLRIAPQVSGVIGYGKLGREHRGALRRILRQSRGKVIDPAAKLGHRIVHPQQRARGHRA